MFAAAESGNMDVINRLCKDKAIELDHQDKFGDTALHFAARDGQQDVCEFLLKRNRRLAKIKNQEGKTALNYANDNA